MASKKKEKIAPMTFIIKTQEEFDKISSLGIVPDRFLRRQDDPEYGYITPERLNEEFKSLEKRVLKLEK